MSATIETATLSRDHDRVDGQTADLLTLALRASAPLAGGIRWRLRRDTVRLSRGPAVAWHTGDDHHELTIPDRWMSSRHAALHRQGDHWLVEDLGSKNGTLINGKQVQTARLEDGDVLELGASFLLLRCQQPIDAGAPDVLDPASTGAPLGFRTLSAPLEHLMAALARAARATVPVLLRGPSGAGKELVAQAIHEQSGRHGAFVPVNCAAIPDSMLEGELFGYRRGAFSGAVRDHVGHVLASDGGTLLLDEIAELREPAQAALLRVLQEREVQALGSPAPAPVDLRVVAATHQDLPALVAAGQFREDLYARLAGICVELPPLRDRREDIGLIAAHVLGQLDIDRDALTLSTAAARALMRHDWPRNARELAQALHGAVALAPDATIALEHLPAELRAPRPAPAGAPAAPDVRARLEQLLAQHGGNISAVARDMNTSRGQIRRYLQRFDLDAAGFRRRDD